MKQIPTILTPYRSAKELLMRIPNGSPGRPISKDGAHHGVVYQYISTNHGLNTPSLCLLEAAAKAVDPTATMTATTVQVQGSQGGYYYEPRMVFQFSDEHPTFPAERMKVELSRLKDSIRASLQPTAGGLYRLDAAKPLHHLPLGRFLRGMLDEHNRDQVAPTSSQEEPPVLQAAFRLPPDVTYTDAAGKTHSGLVDYDTLAQYRASQPDPKSSVDPYIDYIEMNDTMRDIVLGGITNGRPVAAMVM